MSIRDNQQWVAHEATGHLIPFVEGYNAANQIIDTDQLAVDQRAEQDLPMNVLDALRASGQGIERQLNSNPAFIFGALTAAFEKLGIIPQGAHNV